ncbi:MAG TPA: hypothetical protein ENF78_03160 [Candidatus Bathyarchaeota archaeon]|nr:hypothetical protein [Candidatus Bathyarchaeota archaeon]
MASGEVEVSPTIRGDKVVRLVVCGVEWPLRAEIPLSEFARIVESIKLLAKYVDFTGMLGPRAGGGRVPAPWTEEELEAFLAERTAGQRAFLELLARKGRVARDEVVRELREALADPSFGSRDLAGLIAGISMRIGNLGKEPLFRVERRRVGGRLMGFYEVSSKYRELLLKLLSGES